jgi:hypothetical protein
MSGDERDLGVTPVFLSDASSAARRSLHAGVAGLALGRYTGWKV